MSDVIDTTNRFLVSSQGQNIIIMLPPRGPISRDDALVLAAHLVAMADVEGKFPAILAAVENT